MILITKTRCRLLVSSEKKQQFHLGIILFSLNAVLPCFDHVFGMHATQRRYLQMAVLVVGVPACKRKCSLMCCVRPARPAPCS